MAEPCDPPKRRKDYDWSGAPDNYTNGAQLRILMDIRDELKSLNALLHCGNFVGIPATLRRISRNTVKPKKKKVPAK